MPAVSESVAIMRSGSASFEHAVFGIGSLLLGFEIGLAGFGRLHDLAANDLGVCGVFKQVVRECFAHHVFHRATNLRAHELVFGLT